MSLQQPVAVKLQTASNPEFALDRVSINLSPVPMSRSTNGCETATQGTLRTDSTPRIRSGQDPSYHILVDFGAEGFGELLRNPRATKARVALLESDNGLDQFPSRPFGSWRASVAGTE